MLTRVAESITNSLITNGNIKSEDKEIYSYGFEMGIAMLGNLLTSILIGLFLGKLVECIVFLLAYMPLRSYAGGYHASSHLRCYFLSSAILILVLLTIPSALALTSPYKSVMLVACSAIIILILSPVQDSNKPLDDDERKMYAKNSKIILSIELCLYFVFVMMRWQTIALVIVESLVVIAITLFIGYTKNQYKKQFIK
ncbi:accessory gene regulator B family protein [Oscillospiraceae bacterium PP1C4]